MTRKEHLQSELHQFHLVHKRRLEKWHSHQDRWGRGIISWFLSFTTASVTPISMKCSILSSLLGLRFETVPPHVSSNVMDRIVKQLQHFLIKHILERPNDRLRYVNDCKFAAFSNECRCDFVGQRIIEIDPFHRT